MTTRMLIVNLASQNENRIKATTYDGNDKIWSETILHPTQHLEFVLTEHQSIRFEEIAPKDYSG